MIIASIILVVAIIVAVVPSFRNTVAGWFTSNTQVEDSTGTTEPTTEGTEPTEPTEGEDVEVPTEPKDEEVKAPFTFEELMTLILTEDGRVRVAPKGATIADLSYVHGDFAVESEEEQQLLVPMNVMVNPYGAISIFEHGVENKPAHAGEVTGATIELCACGKWHHEANLFTNWGIQDLTSDEGNLALGPNSWTRMDGQMTELLLNYQEREIIRATACTWTVVNESGVEERFYGIRICGEQKDPEPPVVEPEKETYTVSFKFVAANGNKLPNGVLSQLPKSVNVTEGETYKVNFTFKSVETEEGTWTFKSWDKTSVKVEGNVTVTGTWIFTEKAGEGDGDEKQEYTVTYKFSNNNLPKEVTNLLPAAKTVVEGTKVTSPSIQNTVTVSDGTWTFNGWDKKEVTVSANVTVTGSWTFKAKEQPPVVKEYTVSYKFVGTKGETVPQEVLSFLPANVTVKEGTIVAPKNLSGVEVEVANGTWKFQGWDRNSATVTSNVTFTGSWKFVEKLTLADPVEDYFVNFQFVSNTNGKNLPASVNSLKPATIVAQQGDVVNAPKLSTTIVEVSGGKWVFCGWTSNSFTVVGDATVTGSWRFDKTPEPEHTVPEGDEDPNPVADNQDELNNLGDRTDEVPEEENNPEHSAQEELSLMPVVEEEEDDDHEEDTNDGINNQHSPVDDGARTDVDADEEDEKQSANNGLSLMPVEGEVDSAEGGESDDLTLSLDLPVDDSEVADQETQDALNAMFGNRE